MWLLTKLLACNTAPTVDVSIEAAEDGALTCRAEVSDAETDALETSYQWNDGATGGTLNAEQAARLRDWTCTATVSDGRASTTGTASWTADGPEPGMYSLVKLATLTGPCDLAALPDGQLLVASVIGRITLFDPDSREVVGQVDLEEGEGGLTSITLDPRFGDGTHDWLYVWRDAEVALSRRWLTLDPFALGEPQPVFEPDCASGELHCSGDLMFWSGEGETLLYLTSNQGPDTDHDDPDQLGSKLMALRVDEETGVGTPAFDDNPVVAIGLRNPWRLADCGAGLCIADPGEDTTEEIDLYTEAGQDFGWPEQEGPGDGPGEDPLVSWDDDDLTWVEEDDGGSGVARFRHTPALGVRLSSEVLGGRLDGWLLYGDFFTGWLRALELSDSGEAGRSVHLAHQSYLASMVESDGEVYAVDLAGGLYRLEVWADRPHIEVETLAETHFDSATAYEVQHALWSNGADKQRAIWLPDGEHIGTSGESWTFPNGTEIFKTFLVAGEPVETRLLTRSEGRWLGATFRWEDNESIRTDGRRQVVTTVDGSDWTIPAEASCADCHDGTRGRPWPLGLEPFVLGDEGLAALAHLLDAPPDPAPEVDGTARDQQVRGYLHVNCAMCHNPGGAVSWSGGPDFDLSYDADLALLGVLAEIWNVTHDEPRTELLVDPDDPEASVLTRVMESTEMPYLSVWTADAEMIGSLHAWIADLDASGE